MASVAVIAAVAATLVPGLQHSTLSCSVRGREISFEELRMAPARGLELRAFANPTARRDPHCRNGYGGSDLPALLEGPQAPKGFKTLGAVNGTVFRVVGHGKYLSNGMLWSKGAGLIAPLRKPGGPRVFVVDSRGGHELRLGTDSRGRIPSTSGFIRDLLARYPTATLALQSNMPLHEGTYAACPADAQGRPLNGGDWRCVNARRTVLCGREDGSVSFLVSPGAFPFELVEGLAPGGPCHASCKWMYNLDGGGSTQMGFSGRDGWEMNGSRMETSQPGCSPYRPVDNYLLMGLVR